MRKESTERKYMGRYKGTFDVFFGMEYRLRKEEMEEQFNREAKEEEDLRRVQQESQRKWQETTIVSTRQEEFLLQSTVTWELLWVQRSVSWKDPRGRAGSGHERPASNFRWKSVLLERVCVQRAGPLVLGVRAGQIAGGEAVKGTRPMQHRPIS